MSIQWFPGHMTKAREVIAETMSSVDVVIEVLDARMPAASENPLVAELRRDKPRVVVLSKSDLADPATTKRWIAWFEGGPHTAVFATEIKRHAEARARVPELCRKVARSQNPNKVLRAMIVGVPNVGKSTLINVMLGRKVAKVGDEPAVTKSKQQVVLPNGIVLTDHPGLTWPKMEDPTKALLLALGGAIPDSAIDYETVGLFAAKLLGERWPDRLHARYKLTEIPGSASDTLTAIGRKRGALRTGGLVDLHKAADVLVHDVRAGALGRLSFEGPPTSP